MKLNDQSVPNQYSAAVTPHSISNMPTITTTVTESGPNGTITTTTTTTGPSVAAPPAETAAAPVDREVCKRGRDHFCLLILYGIGSYR